jgi:LuxR family maltose regulon positive regulatory protein
MLAECEQKGTPGLILQETAIAVPALHLAIERKSQVEFARRLLDILDVSRAPEPVTVPETGQTLTRREAEVLQLIAGGASNQDLAKRLVVSENTVKAHVTNIFAKMNVTSRTQAIARAHELHLV